ncbi:hypothetical protein NLU13_8300 [Sarocladium strictum]|uniref:Transmembrane protein UsgS n=1 Tax=Sarocladium strictum TaxID=5046 RepID=A0AA39L4V3_SARSR|nr:hypothetical protein NLU13_8300 [Sarocladium strictum]
MAAKTDGFRAEAAQLKHTLKENIDMEKLKRELDVSNFEPNAVIRALQNPGIFSNDHYKQAAAAVIVGICIRLAVMVPVLGIRVFLWFLSWFVSLGSAAWTDDVSNGLSFIEEYVLQVPFFLMTLMRYLVPTLDNLFMQSLQWVDFTYVQKHKQEDPDELRPMFYTNLRMYRKVDGSTHSESTAQAVSMFLYRFARKGAISIAVYALSYLPVVGRFVLPAASFYTFNRAVGLGPALGIFGMGIFLPRRWLVVFLQSYFSSRSLMRELLEPYFSRVKFSKEQKRAWFRSREGVLFGFGLGFYTLIKVPLLGVLIYGIAEASTAYLITKITDPPPPPAEMDKFTESQQLWRNKHEFLNLSLGSIDTVHFKPVDKDHSDRS